MPPKTMARTGSKAMRLCGKPVDTAVALSSRWSCAGARDDGWSRERIWRNNGKFGVALYLNRRLASQAIHDLNAVNGHSLRFKYRSTAVDHHFARINEAPNAASGCRESGRGEGGGGEPMHRRFVRNSNVRLAP